MDATMSREAEPVNLLAQLAARERELRAEPSRRMPRRSVIGTLAAMGILTIAAAVALRFEWANSDASAPIIAAPAPPPARVPVAPAPQPTLVPVAPATPAIEPPPPLPSPVALPEVASATPALPAPPRASPAIREQKTPARTPRAEIRIEPYRNGMPATRLTGEALRLALIEDSRITREFNAASLRRAERAAAPPTEPD